MVAKAPVDIESVDILPILPSSNFSQTADFYVNHLGFQEIETPCGSYYRTFKRGRMELCFWHCTDPTMAVNSSVFIRTASSRDLLAEYLERGVEGVRPSNDCEDDQPRTDMFHVRDPHGNLLMFLPALAVA